MKNKKYIPLVLLTLLATVNTSAQNIISTDKSNNVVRPMDGNNGVLNGVDAKNKPNILKGSDASKQSNIANGKEAKVYRPEPTINMSKKEYEEDLKKRGVTVQQDLERVKNAEVSSDGFIKNNGVSLNKPGVVPVDKNGNVSVYDIQKSEILKEIEEAKEAARIKGVPDGENKQYFEELAKQSIKKAEGILLSVEKDLYTKRVLISDYERAEKQIEMMSILVTARYSDEISKKAEDVKTQAYLLMRQMLAFILSENTKKLQITSLSKDFKLLKVVSNDMSSAEVIRLKYITENAFSIGFEKVIYTNNASYAVEEDVKEYIKKIKEDKKNNKK
jgi:hypothetical protein